MLNESLLNNINLTTIIYERPAWQQKLALLRAKVLGADWVLQPLDPQQCDALVVCTKNNAPATYFTRKLARNNMKVSAKQFEVFVFYIIHCSCAIILGQIPFYIIESPQINRCVHVSKSCKGYHLEASCCNMLGEKVPHGRRWFNLDRHQQVEWNQGC